MSADEIAAEIDTSLVYVSAGQSKRFQQTAYYLAEVSNVLYVDTLKLGSL